MAWYIIRRMCLSPPHFQVCNPSNEIEGRAFLHLVFGALICFLMEKRESPQSPWNFVVSSTGTGIEGVLILEEITRDSV